MADICGVSIAKWGVGCSSLDGEINPSQLVIGILGVARFPATGRGLVVEGMGKLRVPRGTSCVLLESVDY